MLRPDPYSSGDYGLRWSPNGSTLAFGFGWGASNHIGLVGSDGSGFRVVGESALGSYDFIWSPDGRSLVVRELPFEEPDGSSAPWGRVWSVDVATGEQTEVQTPVESWQRLAP
jgi:TolB protein